MEFRAPDRPPWWVPKTLSSRVRTRSESRDPSTRPQGGLAPNDITTHLAAGTAAPQKPSFDQTTSCGAGVSPAGFVSGHVSSWVTAETGVTVLRMTAVRERRCSENPKSEIRNPKFPLRVRPEIPNSEFRIPNSVPIPIRLIRPLHRDIDVIRLLLRERRQLRTELIEVESRHFLIELLR